MSFSSEDGHKSAPPRKFSKLKTTQVPRCLRSKRLPGQGAAGVIRILVGLLGGRPVGRALAG
jgi:hypothetical protein